jgi:hypothetical protein
MIILPKVSELAESIMYVMGSSDAGMHNKKIDELVALNLKLTSDQTSQIRLGKRTEFGYRMAWARQRLKQEKKIENEGKGFWKKTK